MGKIEKGPFSGGSDHTQNPDFGPKNGHFLRFLPKNGVNLSKRGV